jgi:hypothetical protein
MDVESPEDQPASYPVGTGPSLLKVKWQDRKADHAPIATAKIKETMHMGKRKMQVPPLWSNGQNSWLHIQRIF